MSISSVDVFLSICLFICRIWEREYVNFKKADLLIFEHHGMNFETEELKKELHTSSLAQIQI